MNDDLLRYYIKRSDERFDQLETKIESLNVWRMKVIGASALILVLVQFFAKVIME